MPRAPYEWSDRSDTDWFGRISFCAYVPGGIFFVSEMEDNRGFTANLYKYNGRQYWIENKEQAGGLWPTVEAAKEACERRKTRECKPRKLAGK